MKKHIDRLKKKSEKDRKRIATIFAGITTLLIVIIWILILVFVKPNNNKNKNKGYFDLLKDEMQKVGDFSEIRLDTNENIDELDNSGGNKNIE